MKRLVGPMQRRRYHRHAGLQRQQRDAGQTALESPAHAERAFGKDADHTATLEVRERATERAGRMIQAWLDDGILAGVTLP